MQEFIIQFLKSQWSSVKDLVKKAWLFCLVVIGLIFWAVYLLISSGYEEALASKNMLINAGLERESALKYKIEKFEAWQGRGGGVSACASVEPICFSKKDKLTQETLGTIYVHNVLLEDECEIDVAAYCKQYERIYPKSVGDKVIEIDTSKTDD